MPMDTLANVADGSDVFVDANIFVYAFTAMSAECTEFLARCARQEVSAVTSYDVIHEATHRLMVHEAFQKALIPKPRAADLQQRPALVRVLTDYWSQVSKVFTMNLVIVPSEESIIRRAQAIRALHGLLTLDSVVVATMEEYGLDRLASHDRDFDPIASLSIFRPTDIP
jgi:uncharacterized protein